MVVLEPKRQQFGQIALQINQGLQTISIKVILQHVVEYLPLSLPKPPPKLHHQHIKCLIADLAKLQVIPCILQIFQTILHVQFFHFLPAEPVAIAELQKFHAFQYLLALLDLFEDILLVIFNSCVGLHVPRQRMIGQTSLSSPTEFKISCAPQSECRTRMSGSSGSSRRSTSLASGSTLKKYSESMERKACWRLRRCVAVRMQRLLYGSLGKAYAMRSSYLRFTRIITIPYFKPKIIQQMAGE